MELNSDDEKGRSISDEELIQRVQAGEVRAFDEVVRRLTPPLFALAFRVLENQHDAEEAVQEVFFKGFSLLDRYDPARPFFPWIYTIALNHVRSLRRRPVFHRRREALPVEEEILADSTRRPGSLVADQANPESGGPEDATLQAETARIIRGALSSLRPIERQVFTLRQYEGLSTDATARVLRIRPNTVKTHLRRARAKIIDTITGDETSSWVLAYKREKGE
ncbi:MAG: RNA polymerase sigma factor [Alkalispirochaeta sp.]